MQRFIRERKTSYLRNVIISVLIFLLIFAGFGCGLTAMNKKMDQEEMQTLQNAITRSVTTRRIGNLLPKFFQIFSFLHI